MLKSYNRMLYSDPEMKTCGRQIRSTIHMSIGTANHSSDQNSYTWLKTSIYQKKKNNS